jgi:micrococcal nuclease
MLKPLFASALIALMLAPLPSHAAAITATDLPPGEDAVVTRVIDGDTIEVRVNDTRFTVRYIGIDAPETRGTQAQTCLSRQATTANRALVQGKTVRLERDVSEFDAFGRLLRYAYLPDGAMVNESLVKNGFAQTLTYPPDVKYAERLAAAQQQARSAGTGLWSKCPGLIAAQPAVPVAPTAVAPIVAAPAAPAAVIAPAANCDPSYPTICIAPGAADLDCPDIPYRRFEVRQPDPHRFDGDKDGIGCEK